MALLALWTFWLLGLLSLVTPGLSGPLLRLAIDDNANFNISLGGRLWLSGGNVVLDGLSAATGTLTLVGPVQSAAGRDPLGGYEATTFAWADAADPETVLLHTTFRQYPHDPTIIVFEQVFPRERLGPAPEPGPDVTTPAADPGLTTAGPQPPSPDGAAGPAHKPPPPRAARTLFPTFVRNVGPADSLDCFAYHGVFPELEPCEVRTYRETHQGGSPLVIYDSQDPRRPMLVFSALDWPKAHHMATGKVCPFPWRRVYRGTEDGQHFWGSVSAPGTRRTSSWATFETQP